MEMIIVPISQVFVRNSITKIYNRPGTSKNSNKKKISH